MNGEVLALKVIAQYGTSDVFAIAKQSDVPIIYQKWHPSTFGEFDRKTKRIYINLNANIEKELIIAHELGHYFINETGIHIDRIAEERMVEEFVKILQPDK